ncbi:hypothetical protein LY76DRAFT_631012 [Colletotrichum caudatum]|nr:hypothetical protein LY76DRAFT_631012 [Colletotrichum caudatum]
MAESQKGAARVTLHRSGGQQADWVPVQCNTVNVMDAGATYCACQRLTSLSVWRYAMHSTAVHCVSPRDHLFTPSFSKLPSGRLGATLAHQAKRLRPVLVTEVAWDTAVLHQVLTLNGRSSAQPTASKSTHMYPDHLYASPVSDVSLSLGQRFALVQGFGSKWQLSYDEKK